jgi:hypothetical protein
MKSILEIFVRVIRRKGQCVPEDRLMSQFFLQPVNLVETWLQPGWPL